MSDQQDAVQSCQACGATIYPEHLEKHAAERVDGQLLCPHCLRERRQTAAPATPGAAPAVAPPPRIHGFSSGVMASAHGPEREFRRPMLGGSPHATRCRTFHCKMTDASMHHLDDQINEWIDASDDIEIKFATSTIGVIEGKHADQHLVITLFY